MQIICGPLMTLAQVMFSSIACTSIYGSRSEKHWLAVCLFPHDPCRLIRQPSKGLRTAQTGTSSSWLREDRLNHTSSANPQRLPVISDSSQLQAESLVFGTVELSRENAQHFRPFTDSVSLSCGFEQAVHVYCGCKTAYPNVDRSFDSHPTGSHPGGGTDSAGAATSATPI